MHVLVTGGTGFVGGWTAKAIADAGHSIRFLVRNPDRLQTSVAKLGVDVSDFAVGDITDRVSVRDALRGCDAVVHSAALVATDPRQTKQMLTTNMQGAQNVLGQSVELGLDPIVHVSSFTALFHPGLETLTADLPVHQVEAGVGDDAKEDADADGSSIGVDLPHEDLGEVLVVGPNVSRSRVGEDVRGGKASVVDHPSPDPDVPPEIGVEHRPDEQRGDDDHHAAQQQRPRAQAISESRQLRVLSGLGMYRGTRWA